MRRIALLLLITALALPVAAGAQGTEKRYEIPLENSPSTGPIDAPVTIVEFLDFQ